MKKNADRAAPTKNARPVRRSPTAKARGARRKSRPKFDLTHALRRYADLYDLAPTGYVSFERSGRIEEINLTAAQLDGMPRDRLIGMPFMTFIAREDASLFLHHLRRSRDSESRVEIEMRLKNAKREIIHAYLSSAPISAAIHNGAVPYQMPSLI
jgi:PAS domain S-box-containing protein